MTINLLGHPPTHPWAASCIRGCPKPCSESGFGHPRIHDASHRCPWECWLSLWKCWLGLWGCWLGLWKCWFCLSECWLGLWKCWFGLWKCWFSFWALWPFDPLALLAIWPFGPWVIWPFGSFFFISLSISLFLSRSLGHAGDDFTHFIFVMHQSCTPFVPPHGTASQEVSTPWHPLPRRCLD